MDRIYFLVYTMPLHQTLFLLDILLLVWCLFSKTVLRVPGRRGFIGRVLCAVCGVVWLYMILTSTVFSRAATERELQLIPFYQLKLLIEGEPEIIRMAWMNMLLFLPGGLLLDALLPNSWRLRTRCVLILLLMAGLSLGIECAQWHWALGRAETDDVICNTLGAALGILVHEGASRAAEEI